MKKLFLVDAYALIYKHYYAFMGRPMRNAEGMNTSAVFGFTKYIRDIIRKERPQYLGVAFDSHGPTFRHEMYEQYKANREAAPEDVHLSVPVIREVLEAMRIPVLEMTGYEADDIIGTLSCKAADEGFDVFMVTPDKDFGQLIRPNIFIYKQKNSGEGIDIIGPEQIKDKYGVEDPCLIADILAIWGDASDNIPGVPGIGEKGAVKLVNQFGTVEQIIDNADQISGKQKELIKTHSDQLRLSKTLALISRDVPIDFVPDELKLESPDVPRLRDVFHRMGFNMFLREIDSDSFMPDMRYYGTGTDFTSSGSAAGGAAGAQGDLFASAGGPAQSPQPELSPTEQYLTGGDATQGDLFSGAGYQNLQSAQSKYHLISDAAQAEKLAAEIRSKGAFSFIAETSGPDVFNDRLIGISFSTEPGEAWFVHFDGTDNQAIARVLRPVFEDPAVSKTGHNIKWAIMVMRQMLGIEIAGPKYDTMILHYLIDSEGRHTVNYMARTYLGYDPVEAEALTGKGVRQLSMGMIPVEQVAEYCSENAEVILRLKEILWPMVVEQEMETVYREIDEPLFEVLAEIELAGVRIDALALQDYGRELTLQINTLEQKIRELAGEPSLNVNSGKQLGEVLFRKMKIDPKPKLTKTKQFRTDEEYLQGFAGDHPIIDMVLEYRGLKRLMTNYIDTLPKMVNRRTGKLHTTYNQATTATGRISSTNPNLQAIPIRDEQGREIRKSFVPSDGDHLLLSVDYSQVELRLMAHFSGDPSLIDAFRNAEDIHRATAARIFGVALEDVTAEQRRRAKVANFGIIYGISAFGLSQRLNIPKGEAKEFIDNYFLSYPGVKKYMDDIVMHAREQGYVKTIYGRRRYLPDIKSANSVTRGWAERNAINSPLQGSAADIMKMAMKEIHRRLEEKGMRSKIILQVHDELVVDVYKPEQAEVEKMVVDAMENAAKLTVKLLVSYGIGKNWLEAH